ncbi:NAD(P)/FAD-dependent oxidoreductase [Micromonosporaceae bacterium Da 78-11]
MATRRVVIIGAGVVGLSLATELGGSAGIEVTVVDRGAVGQLTGSTGHAPGFFGVHHDIPVLTELARLSTDRYEELPGDGFTRTGGMEVAISPAGLAEIERRAGSADGARMLSEAQATALAPYLVDRCLGAALFSRDGTAETRTLAAALHAQAAELGVRFVGGTEVRDITVTGDRVRAVDGLAADDVVVAGGIWGPVVAALAGFELELTPVAHPYVHGPAVHLPTTPFVRWPEQHVYARGHGDRLGLGTYDHEPVPVEDLGDRAERDWLPEVFDAAVARGMALLPEPSRFTPAARLNGVFAMTADNLPLLGPAPGISGLWLAEALWVTHAAGAARQLARMMTGAPVVAGLELLRAERFAGHRPSDLRDRALSLYRDIYTADS